MSTSRRTLLTRALGASAGLGLSSRLVAGGQAAAPAAPKKPAGKPIGDEGVGPGEDLMREHGVLNRILLVYDEAIRRDRAGRRRCPPTRSTRRPTSSAASSRAITRSWRRSTSSPASRRPASTSTSSPSSAGSTRPAGGSDGRDSRGDLGRGDVATDAGRRRSPSTWAVRPHVPAARGPRGHRALPGVPRPRDEGRVRRARRGVREPRDQVLGERGFERIVDEVAAIERRLGIGDLDSFTPKA